LNFSKTTLFPNDYYGVAGCSYFLLFHSVTGFLLIKGLMIPHHNYNSRIFSRYIGEFYPIKIATSVGK
jgi:uncharacterized protein (UPF0332 family)